MQHRRKTGSGIGARGFFGCDWRKGAVGPRAPEQTKSLLAPIPLPQKGFFMFCSIKPTSVFLNFKDDILIIIYRQKPVQRCPLCVGMVISACHRDFILFTPPAWRGSLWFCLTSKILCDINLLGCYRSISR